MKSNTVSIHTVNTEFQYGEVFLYDGLELKYIFSPFDKDCGDSIDAFDRFFEQNNCKDVSNLLLGLLKIKGMSNLSINPNFQGKNIIYQWKQTDKRQTINIKKLNIDQYWKALTKEEKQTLLKNC